MKRLPTVSAPILLLLMLCCSVTALSQPMRIDFRQAANNDSPYSTGEVHWVQSILHQNNAVYYEGMSVPQRIVLMNVPATQGNVHKLTFSHRATKNGKHAYDYLTSWSQAEKAATAIVGPSVMSEMNPWGDDIGPPKSMQSMAKDLRTNGYSLPVRAPTKMSTLLTHSIESSVQQYEKRFGDRTVQIYGEEPITDAELRFDGYTPGRDAMALYTLTWTSESKNVIVEFATHLAMGSDVTGAGGGIGYGGGYGAGSISGGSYHVTLEKLDGSPLGSQDNQIKSAAVMTSIICGTSGPDLVCMRTQHTYTFGGAASNYTYSWSLADNTSGATILGSTTGESVLVDAGPHAGSFTLSLIVRDGLQTVICPMQVKVLGFGVMASAKGQIACVGGTAPVTVTASGGTAPYNGTGTFHKKAGTHTFTVTDANGCANTASITLAEPASACVANAFVTSEIDCYGGTGTVEVTATGGTPPYTGTGTFTKSAGTHTFTVYDANNCAATTSVTLTQPASALSISAAITSTIDCYGGSATVDVAASGGTPPYTGTGTFSKAAGTHTFTVTDANNCAESTTLTITQPSQSLSASAAVTSAIDCYGGNGTVEVTATGGTPPYSGTGTFIKAAGTYTFTVTDANNCTATASATLTQPASAVTVSAAVTSQIDCYGGTGTVTVTASGGTPPYTGTGTQQLSGGTHTITVTDANGCAASTTVTLSQPASALSISAAVTSAIDCYGGTATVDVTATGGTPPYSGTGTFSVAAGTHTFTVTDANNCTESTTLTITQPSQALAATAAVTSQIDCYGGTGTVQVSASGGTPPYTGTGTFNKSAGTYTFTVTDANNCTATASATLTQPASAVTVNAAVTSQIDCYGGTGTVDVTATGGTPPYTGTGTFSMAAGTHTFTVTDANGCAASASVTLTQPANPLSVSAAVTTAIDCYGGTATVTVSATGGTPPYAGTGTFTKSAGTYTFTVTDANGCMESTTLTITQPANALTASATVTSPIMCYGGTGTVTVTASGGTPPYSGTGTFTKSAGTYTFTVTDANNCTTTTTVTLTEPSSAVSISAAVSSQIDCYGGTGTVTVTATGGTPPYTGTGTFSKTAGTHTFTVTDANGCQASTSVTLTQPSQALTASASATPILCNGGSSTVTVTATGGTPPYTGVTTYTRGPGTYNFVVTDANNCTAIASVTITEPPKLVASANVPPIPCNGGTTTITVSAIGGTLPYTGTGTFQVGAGTYTYMVTDDNGCTDTVKVTVTEPPTLIVGITATPILCNGGSSTVTITASGGTPPYAGDGVFLKPAGSYTFTVTDANGCSESVSITITEPPLLTLTANATTLTCGRDTATVTVSASGGTSPYTGTGTFRRTLGTHSFTVEDANGCKDSVQVTVTGPPPIYAAANATPILCHGDLSTITVSGWGGTPPYSGVGIFYKGAGTYTFVVSDANNCTDTVEVTITEPPDLVASITAAPIACNGGTTTITVTASGGTPPYNGVGSFTRGPGTHTFVVTDGNGCKDSVSITLDDPPPLFVAAIATPILCHGDLSTVTVTATGGTPPYTGTGTFTALAGTHTYVVTDSRGCNASTTITITEPPELKANANAPSVSCGRDSAVIRITAIGGTTPYSGTGDFKRLAGTYTFIVTDANGCADTVQATIASPPPVYATAAATPVLCHGGFSDITVSAWGGTPPYSGVGTFTYKAGTYTFIVTDANNCTDTVTIHVPEPPPLNVVCNVSPCINGIRTVSATVSGGTPPYSYLWMPSQHMGPMFDIPCNYNGTITLQVRDANWDPNDPNNAACEAFCTLNIFSKGSAEQGGEPSVTGSEYALYENYPNPFNPTTTIQYFVPEASHVRLSIINTLGKTITTLVDTEVPAGMHSAVWNATANTHGSKVASGSYIYRIHATSRVSNREFVKERLMLLLK